MEQEIKDWLQFIRGGKSTLYFFKLCDDDYLVSASKPKADHDFWCDEPMWDPGEESVLVCGSMGDRLLAGLGFDPEEIKHGEIFELQRSKQGRITCEIIEQPKTLDTEM